MEKVKAYLKKNAVMRFLMSYLLILLMVFISCFAGFQKTFDIVEEKIIEENLHLMENGTDQIDKLLSDIYVSGMRISLSASLRHLGSITSQRNSDYYYTVKNVLEEYSDTIRYYDTDLRENTFIYVNSLDRVLFDNAVYIRDTFQSHPDQWELGMEEWLNVCSDEKTAPYFYTAKQGELFYIFPCIQSMQEQVRLGTVFFHISRQAIVEQMSFLENYHTYSFAVSQNGSRILEQDGMEIEGEWESEWTQTPGIYNTEQGDMVFSMESNRDHTVIYTMIIPQEEALVKLHALRMRIWILLSVAAAGGIAAALFFSMQSGKPINKVINMLKETYSDVSFSSINDTIGQIIQEQRKDQKELQKTFFHNLLKADFLSKAEMEYMALRAELQLVGEIYYAAEMRLFTEIDTDSIDGQTVEEARAIQVLLKEKLEQAEFPIWSYKRNTLVMLYIIEINEQELLLKLLREITKWLKETCHVDAYWGVGNPCRDLMYFWKSAEEAHAALIHGEGEYVSVYSDIRVADDSYWMPYAVEEHFMQGLRAGDMKTVQNALEIIEAENFKSRVISRKQFLKLNSCICDILAEPSKILEDDNEGLIHLSSLIPEHKESCEPYFVFAEQLCGKICERVANQKSKNRSEKVQAIAQFVEDNYSDQGMGLGMVSRQFKLSEGYLSAMFKKEMEINFADYLEQIRIEAACKMLREGFQVTVVAEKAGYNSVQSFRRAFKRVKNINPSEYRG